MLVSFEMLGSLTLTTSTGVNQNMEPKLDYDWWGMTEHFLPGHVVWFVIVRCRDAITNPKNGKNFLFVLCLCVLRLCLVSRWVNYNNLAKLKTNPCKLFTVGRQIKTFEFNVLWGIFIKYRIDAVFNISTRTLQNIERWFVKCHMCFSVVLFFLIKNTENSLSNYWMATQGVGVIIRYIFWRKNRKSRSRIKTPTQPNIVW